LILDLRTREQVQETGLADLGRKSAGDGI
jgi:hypothetical protein